MLLSMLSPLMLPSQAPASAYLAIVPFFRNLLHAEPGLFALTLAGTVLVPLALRLLDGRPIPLLYRGLALAASLLGLAWVAGLVPVAWSLAVATLAVLLLLLDELMYVVVLLVAQTVHVLSAPMASGRRRLPWARRARPTAATSDNGAPEPR